MRSGLLGSTGWAQESLAFIDTAVQLLHVHCAVCRCTVLLEHKSRYRTLRVAGSSMKLRQQYYDVVKQHRRSQ